MEQDDKFDDLIRQKFAENEFIFNEENWAKAEKKIDTVRRLRKIYLWTSIFIVGIFIGIGLMLLLSREGKNENTKINTKLNPKKDNQIEILSSVKSDNEKALSPAISSKQVVNTVSQVEKENSLPPSTGIKSNDISTENPDKAEQSIANKTVDPNKQIIKNGIQELKQPVGVKAKKAENSGKTEKKRIQNNKSPLLTEFAESGKSDDKSKSNATKELIVKNEPKINSTVIASSQLETKSQINNEEAPITQNIPEEKIKNEVQTTAQVVDKKEDTKSNSFNSVSQKSENKNAKPEESVSVPDQTKKTEIKGDAETTPELPVETQKLVSDSAKLTSDSSIVSKQNILTPPPPIPSGLASATFFSIDAGTNLEIGWKYEDATEAGGFNPVLGLGITHYFNQKWSFNSGVQYGSIGYLKASKKSFSDVTYGFGSTTIDTIIDTRFLHYAVAPLLFQYSFNDKNTISFGGSISYLLNSKSKLSIKTTTVTAVTIDSNEVNSSEKSETGYYANAFNNWDASLAFGYRRRISQKFNVSAIANFGLLDIKNNSFFSREVFERNIGMKITLTYNLFDF